MVFNMHSLFPNKCYKSLVSCRNNPIFRLLEFILLVFFSGYVVDMEECLTWTFSPFLGTDSNVAAGKLFGIPLRGTHSHAFVSSFMVCISCREFHLIFVWHLQRGKFDLHKVD